MRFPAVLVLAAALAAPLPAMQFQFKLDNLEAKASGTVDIALNGSTLQFAAKFLDSKDPEEAEVKKLIAGLEGIVVKSFSFKSEGAYTAADLDGVRGQLKGSEWLRIVRYKSTEDGDSAEVYVRYQDRKVRGVAILSAGPKQLTVVNIAGTVDLDSLANLSGHFGVPKLDSAQPSKSKKPE